MKIACGSAPIIFVQMLTGHSKHAETTDPRQQEQQPLRIERGNCLGDDINPDQRNTEPAAHLAAATLVLLSRRKNLAGVVIVSD